MGAGHQQRRRSVPGHHRQPRQPGPPAARPARVLPLGPLAPDHPDRPGTRPADQLQHRLPRPAAVSRRAALLLRWTAGAENLHPHEPAAGLLGLLHGASAAELRQLRVTDIDLSRATVRLGRRPHPVPLDPATSAALRRCLDHHDRHHRGGNPHLLVNQKSKTTAGPVSVSYLEKLLSPAAVTPTLLRVTRLAHLVTTLDPVIVAAAFGVRRGTVLHYLADTVDASRLANL